MIPSHNWLKTKYRCINCISYKLRKSVLIYRFQLIWVPIRQRNYVNLMIQSHNWLQTKYRIKVCSDNQSTITSIGSTNQYEPTRIGLMSFRENTSTNCNGPTFPDSPKSKAKWFWKIQDCALLKLWCWFQT